MRITKGHKELFRLILAIVMISGFFAVMGFMILKDKYSEAVLTMVGALTGSVLTIINYEWGSSKGSSEKNDILNTKINPNEQA